MSHHHGHNRLSHHCCGPQKVPKVTGNASYEQELDERLLIVREVYDVVESHRFEDFCPPDLSRATDRIDLHVHVGPGRQHPVALGKHASSAGVRALVLKNPFLGSTCELARRSTGELLEWAEREGIARPVRLIASVVMKGEDGGVCVDHVKEAIANGAAVVWFPVLDAANHLERAKGIAAVDAWSAGQSVLRGDSLKPEALEILDLVAGEDVAISFGHLAADEILALAEASRDMGITRAFVDHPLSPVANLSLEEMVQLGRCGVTCNLTYWELSPYCGVSARDMVDVIRAIGVPHTTLSSDAGMEIFPDSVECLRLHAAMLDLYGFSTAEQAMLLGGNQRRILNIDE